MAHLSHYASSRRSGCVNVTVAATNQAKLLLVTSIGLALSIWHALNDVLVHAYDIGWSLNLPVHHLIPETEASNGESRL
jgi:hypothetical protein